MLTRIISAAVLIPAVIWCIYEGGLPLTLLILAACAMGLSEFFDFCKAKSVECMRFPAQIISALYILNSHFTGVNDKTHGFEFSPLLVLGFVFLILWLTARRKTDGSILEISATIFGFLYISVFLSFAIYIRNLEYGRDILFLVIIMVWAADTFAYFGGMRFGKSSKRLSPEVSPKKSVIGVYSGLMGTVAASILFFHYMPVANIPFYSYILFAFALNVFSVLGDLVESQFKRDCQIKDSSAIIPGHGGILDRVDSLLLALPFSYYYFVFFIR
ncbi:MAG TPA: phosphatidate cytidylyltransferase [Candidatus Wallbacteria bacterium]|nr:phosphatidate cytidylyltransferase [Candidatus Wallbacteria bacterium]